MKNCTVEELTCISQVLFKVKSTFKEGRTLMLKIIKVKTNLFKCM